MFVNFNFKEYNIADWFSFYRIIVTPVILYSIFSDQRIFFSVLILLSFLSDAIDGILARRLKISSERGAFLDSLGDILLLVVAVLGAFWFEPGLFAENKLPILLVLGLYAFLSFIVYIKYRRPSSFHTYLAKATFVLLAIFFVYLFFFGFSKLLFYAVIVLSTVELLEEIIIALLLKQNKTNVKGLYWVLKSGR
ncbi:MAG TPA: CDP-alcohol phosphatidyltransferase family protein [Candidatus Paceibacterota bacterium]|uniref:Putative CDP-alcohol phosphatidyltransferase, CDP-diacylglycerol--glycerol-3-phosphate 3-phosphatidyltransferase n=1 Tax=uncultured Parcubacteria bacterium Rifle_16ft_4_minimus_2958 TaxID=1665137 RepID=A0A0H4T2L3_9BACT|nr:putative CDP-alcohol phosphatidyltransferase, CDP-diacylglycerol--glycerol-3-phosphate 3-phosphatidyltransferase [uncultured Parcubacteria bacterium Rifle_16ft_4_minimus_2958]